jgi:hypothetical integral membrane protein (TIGR02206 family)
MLSDSGFLSNDIPFASFGHSHAVTVFVFIVLLGLSTLTALRLSDRENLIVTRISSLFLCFTVVAWTAITLALDRFNVDQSLPLSICNLFSLVAPILFWTPNQRRFEIVYFFVLSGTLQAIITPDPEGGFPSYGFFKYWIVHCGLVIVVIHHLIAFKLFPRAKGILVTFMWLNIYILCLIPINLFLDANYFYLMRKPITPTLLDFFGPWPNYIFATEVLAIVVFAIMYMPILFVRTYYEKTDTIDG